MKIKLKQDIGYTFRKGEILTVVRDDDPRYDYVVEAIHKTGKLQGKTFYVGIDKKEAMIVK